jgi:hypothetical protein
MNYGRPVMKKNLTTQRGFSRGTEKKNHGVKFKLKNLFLHLI